MTNISLRSKDTKVEHPSFASFTDHGRQNWVGCLRLDPPPLNLLPMSMPTMVPVDVKQLIIKQSISQKYKSVIMNNIKRIRINTDFRMSEQCVTFLQMTQVT